MEQLERPVAIDKQRRDISFLFLWTLRQNQSLQPRVSINVAYPAHVYWREDDH